MLLVIKKRQALNKPMGCGAPLPQMVGASEQNLVSVGGTVLEHGTRDAKRSVAVATQHSFERDLVANSDAAPEIVIVDPRP